MEPTLMGSNSGSETVMVDIHKTFVRRMEILVYIY